ncbi:A-kinase anchor protein 7-like isoform X2 [Trichomycterus rosablanca]|uniref:A-kinase anchor protein 7-like isoform X2 n=1 Tax=Trichomycterus rosablanca TaxID=2290929 RepID=UPI002F3603EA
MFRLHVCFIKAANKTLPRWFGVCTQVKPPILPLIIKPHHPERKSVVITSACCISEKYKSLMEGGGELTSSAQMEQGAVHKNVKARRLKRNQRKPRGRKPKAKETDSTMKLLAELPFTNTETWKELGFYDPDASGKTKRKRKEKGQDEEEEDRGKEKKKKGSPRPNYFVSIPITNQKIKQGVEEVQAEVLQKEPRLSRALIPIGTLHITVLVTHLATQEEINAAALALEEMQSTLTSLVGGRSLVLPFRGIGHFRQEVAFIQIEDGEHLDTLTHIADSVRRAFDEKGIPIADQKAFTPHLTFIKLSRAPTLRRKGIKKLDPGLYGEFEQKIFGQENVCRLDLCSMLKKKDADGYYHREKTVTFGGKRGPELDDDELMSLSKRLVEDAVSRAVQQYMEETQQNGAAPKDEAPPVDGLTK